MLKITADIFRIEGLMLEEPNHPYQKVNKQGVVAIVQGRVAVKSYRIPIVQHIASCNIKPGR